MGKKKKKKRNPWTAADVKRHNKKCAAKSACRRKWPKIANAVLRKTGDEGRAIRIANWQTNRMGLRRRRRNPDATPEQNLLRGAIQRATGRPYSIDVSLLDPESVREFLRLLRDVESEKQRLKNKLRRYPFPGF